MTKQTITHYSLEFKQSSAKLAIESDQPIVKTANELGLKPSTLYCWVSQYGNKPLKTSSPKNDIEAENVRLKKENARLKQERDILKKAAAYFANDTK